MKEEITHEHKKQFVEMKKNLAAIGSKEESFLKAELLFFDVINVARTYGDDPAENKFLSALKQLQANEYRETEAKFKKSTQRERVISRFSNQLRGILTAAIKNNYFTQAVST